jgi:hypothetical protein
VLKVLDSYVPFACFEVLENPILIIIYVTVWKVWAENDPESMTFIGGDER